MRPSKRLEIEFIKESVVYAVKKVNFYKITLRLW